MGYEISHGFLTLKYDFEYGINVVLQIAQRNVTL